MDFFPEGEVAWQNAANRRSGVALRAATLQVGMSPQRSAVPSEPQRSFRAAQVGQPSQPGQTARSAGVSVLALPLPALPLCPSPRGRTRLPRPPQNLSSSPRCQRGSLSCPQQLLLRAQSRKEVQHPVASRASSTWIGCFVFSFPTPCPDPSFVRPRKVSAHLGRLRSYGCPH